eukprot:Selendium_serpulae@DN6321_c1_g1_i13.p1
MESEGPSSAGTRTDRSNNAPMPLEQPFIVHEITAVWNPLAEKYGIEASYSGRSFLLSLWGAIANLLASFVIAIECVLTFDAMVGCTIASVTTWLFWFFDQRLPMGMNWNLVSLAIIFPVTQGIAMAFTRRELALSEFSIFLGNMRSIWEALHTWVVKGGDDWTVMTGRFGDRNELARFERQQVFHELLVAVIAYFDVPRGQRARNTVICGGKAEALKLHCCVKEQRLAVEAGVSRLRRLVQDSKIRGLGGGEVHRVDFYVNNMGVSMERLAGIKEYRTPRAMRAYARVYILIIGAFYGPDYLSSVYETANPRHWVKLGLGLLYACGIQVVLWGLFHIMRGLEDPFARFGGRGQVDSVRVTELAEVERRLLLKIERSALEPWGDLAEKETWSQINSIQKRTSCRRNS